MALIDIYLRNMNSKRDDITKLTNDKAKEFNKANNIRTKINSAKRSLASTKSASMIKSKTSEIARYEKDLISVDNKIANIEKKIAQKNKDFASEEKKYQNEKAKIEKKIIENDKKRLRESERQMSSIIQSVSSQGQEQEQIKNELAKLKSIPEIITVLFFASNPRDTSPLELDVEAREIQRMIRLSKHRDSVKFETRLAVRPADILQAINELNPTIVHFSGHGDSGGI